MWPSQRGMGVILMSVKVTKYGLWAGMDSTCLCKPWWSILDQICRGVIWSSVSRRDLTFCTKHLSASTSHFCSHLNSGLGIAQHHKFPFPSISFSISDFSKCWNLWVISSFQEQLFSVVSDIWSPLYMQKDPIYELLQKRQWFRTCLGH